MTCEFADDDGAYVLGALSPAEHLQFEQHLSGCAECSRSVGRMAGLPGLLARVDPSVLEEPDRSEPVPDTLLPALVRAVRRNRLRRRAFVGAAAAAVVLVAVPGSLAVRNAAGHDTTVAAPPASTATYGRSMAPVGGAPVSARLALDPVSWGTRLHLTCTYHAHGGGFSLPSAVQYNLVVHTRDGRSQQVGTWRALDGRTMRLTAATAAPRRDIASVEVLTADGRPVLELPS